MASRGTSRSTSKVAKSGAYIQTENRGIRRRLAADDWVHADHSACTAQADDAAESI
jgi:hypothetical protein